VQLVPSSRWQSIFKETAFEVSTRHGHPLHPRDKHEKHSQPFPWKGLAYLRSVAAVCVALLECDAGCPAASARVFLRTGWQPRASTTLLAHTACCHSHISHTRTHLIHRLRQYKLLTPAGAYVPTAMPGAADVTLKMKKIDPDTGLGGMSLPKEVRVCVCVCALCSLWRCVDCLLGAG
jgi:hypothetical protein